MNQKVAWAVPFLLILLAIRTAPDIVRVIDNHFFSAPPTTIATHPLATGVHHHQLTPSHHQPAPAVTTTTLGSGSASSIGSIGKLSVSASAPSGSSAEITGTLKPPFLSAAESVDAGTTWNVTADGPINWSLSCNGVAVSAQAQPTVVPNDGVDCEITISTTETSGVTWTLHPVS